MVVPFPDEAKLLYKYIANQLSTLYDQQEAQNISRILLRDDFEITQTDLILNKKIILLDQQKEKLQNALNRLKLHEPIQYVTGKCFFYGHEFMINKHVLIPRPETEELVSLILENAPLSGNILDIGTGSGCIAIALAKVLPGCRVTAIDVDKNSLETANQNSIHLNANVHFELMDILSTQKLDNNYDIIVSNPPYVLPSDREEMSNNVMLFEPAKALFVPEDDPLLFYRKIGELSQTALSKNGNLYFEIHEKMGKDIGQMLEDLGYKKVMIYKDMQGKDRMIRAQFK